MSNKRKKYEKHPYSVRLQVVAKVLCEHLPLRTTGKMFDVNPRQVKYWVSLYSRYGEEGLRMQHRYYPVDFKYKVLQDVFENHFSIHTPHFAESLFQTLSGMYQKNIFAIRTPYFVVYIPEFGCHIRYGNLILILVKVPQIVTYIL